MIPIGDARRRFGFPWMTACLLLGAVLLFLYERNLPPSALIIHNGLVPHDVALRISLGLRVGSLWDALTYSLVQGPNLFEMVVNLVYLWVLGSKVEDACGPGGLLLLCVLSSVGGAVSASLLTPNYKEPIYGLAGVVAGLMGAFFVLYRMQPIRSWFPPLILVRVPAFLHLLYWGVLEFVRVDRAAFQSRDFLHLLTLEPAWPLVGGIVVGLLGGYLFVRRAFLYYNMLAAKSSGR